MMLAFGPLEKDRGGVDTGIVTIAKNCYPISVGYGPMPSLAEYGSNELPAGCVGMFFARTSSNAYKVFAGTATNLYELVSGSWVSRTRATGGPYTTISGNIWDYDQWGSLLIVVNGSDAPQYINVDTGAANFAPLAGSPPVAKRVRVVGDFVWLLDANNPRRLIWCGTTGPNTATSWTLGTDLCDEYIAPDGGNIVTAPMLGEYGLFLQDGGVARRVVLQPGDPFSAFRFEKLEGIKACVPGYNQIAAKGRIYYIAENGPHVLGPDGSNEAIAEQRVREEFLETCDPARIERVQGFADPYSSRIYWAYHSQGAGSAYDRLLGYDIDQNRFFFAEITAQFWAPIALPGTNLDALDTDYPSIDAMTVSLDSRQFQGGRPTIGAVTENRLLGLLSGPELPATIRIAPTNLIPGSRAFLSQVEPKGDWGEALVRLMIGRREHMGQSSTWTGPFNVSSETGIIYTRSSARIHELELQISGEGWKFAQGLMTTEQPDGQR